MAEPDASPYLVKFDTADTAKKGKIGLAAFTPLIGELIGSQDPKKAELYFRGIDIDGSNEVSREEFEDFVKGVLRKDPKYIIKLIFRAFDKDRSSTLQLGEIKEIGEFVGHPLDDATVKAKIKEITGKEGSALTFAQVVKLLTGETIKEDTDPYDGKLKKSGCCLLL
jgi:Ca2+-binding EF-hand superfamily protein